MPYFPRELALDEILLNIDVPDDIGSDTKPDNKQATLCLDAQERWEMRQKQLGDAN